MSFFLCVRRVSGPRLWYHDRAHCPLLTEQLVCGRDLLVRAVTMPTLGTRMAPPHARKFQVGFSLSHEDTAGFLSQACR